jgi:hypothetical protein
MAASAQFTSVPAVGIARLTGASNLNTARDGSGTEGTTITQLIVAASTHTRIDRIIITASGTANATTGGIIRIFIKDGTGNKRLWREYPVTAVTPTASVAGFTNFTTSLIDGGLILKSGYSLWVTSHILDSAGNQFDIIALGGDF